MSETTKLITAKEAVRLLGAELRDDEAAKKMLSSRLKDGLLALRAQWIAFQFDVGGVPARVPSIAVDRVGSEVAFHVSGPTEEVAIEILPTTWSDCRDFENEVRRWDWAYGSFVASGSKLKVADKPILKINGKALREREIIGGVHFIADEIKNLLKEMRETPSPARNPDDTYTAQDATIEWVAECIVDSYDKGIDPNINASKLIKRVKNRLASRGFKEPGQSTIYPFATRIVERLKEYLAE